MSRFIHMIPGRANYEESAWPAPGIYQDPFGQWFPPFSEELFQFANWQLYLPIDIRSERQLRLIFVAFDDGSTDFDVEIMGVDELTGEITGFDSHYPVTAVFAPPINMGLRLAVCDLTIDGAIITDDTSHLVIGILRAPSDPDIESDVCLLSGRTMEG